MENINDIFELTEYVINKEQNGRAFSNTQFNLLLGGINLDVIKKRYGLPEEYQIGMPLPREAYQLTQKITDDLRHLLVYYGGSTLPLYPVSSTGILQLPSDYLHISSLRVPKGDDEFSDIEILFDNELSDRLRNPNRNDFDKWPIGSFYSDYIKLYPADIGYVEFTYIKVPNTPRRAVTINPTTDVETYDPANSVQLDWPKDVYMDVVRYLLSLCGVHLNSPRVYQYAEQHKKTGV
jgi:hypothetical protein